MELNKQYIHRIIEQSKNKSNYLKLDVFKDEIFKTDLNSIGTIVRQKTDLDPMKNIPTSIQKRLSRTMSLKNQQHDLTDPEVLKKIEWKRIGEVKKDINLIHQNNSSLVNDDLISDVIQGHLGNCYFLSAISSFSEFKTKIKYIFENHYDPSFKNFKINPNGLYEVKVFVNGKMIELLIDDFFPCLINEGMNPNQPDAYTLAFSIIYEKSNNIWPIILEKAWSKINGSYGNIIKGNIPQAFQFISPSPVEVYLNSKYYPNKVDEFHLILNQADDKQHIICADISDDIPVNLQILTASMGLLRNHAYSVISIWELKMRDGDIQKLLKIRNPWGNLEWNGDWSDESKLWTEDLKREVGYLEKDDGCFFMSFEDFLKFFTTTYICTDQQTFCYTYKKIINHERNSFFYFTFNLSKDIEGYFIVNLKSTKIRKNLFDHNFENSYVSMFLFKEISTTKNQVDYEYVSSIISNSDRISIRIEEPGRKYILLIKINNENYPKDFLYNMDDFVNEKLPYKCGFKLGLYSNLKEEDYKLNRMEGYTGETIKRLFIKSMDKVFAKMPQGSKVNFYDENEKDTFRVLDFESENTAFGIYSYNNESKGVIHEKINVKNMNNISYIPILDDDIFPQSEKIEIKSKNQPELEIEENIFDDDNENEFLRHFKTSDNFSTTLDIPNKIKTGNDLSSKEIYYKIRPNSKYFGIFFKNSENTDFDINSKICIKYPLSCIWQEKQFETRKTKLKFKETSIPIIETIVKYNNGIIIKYKNKTNDFIAEVKIKISNGKNIKANKENLIYFDRIYGDEAEGIIKIYDDNSCMMVINPGEMAFVEYTSIDIYDEISYDVNFSYNIYAV